MNIYLSNETVLSMFIFTTDLYKAQGHLQAKQAANHKSPISATKFSYYFLQLFFNINWQNINGYLIEGGEDGINFNASLLWQTQHYYGTHNSNLGLENVKIGDSLLNSIGNLHAFTPTKIVSILSILQ